MFLICAYLIRHKRSVVASHLLVHGAEEAPLVLAALAHHVRPRLPGDDVAGCSPGLVGFSRVAVEVVVSGQLPLDPVHLVVLQRRSSLDGLQLAGLRVVLIEEADVAELKENLISLCFLVLYWF